MVPGHAGEGEKQQINVITRNIHMGVHDTGTVFCWHPEMESLQQLQLFYVCGDLEEQIQLSTIRKNQNINIFWDRDEQLG